MTAEQTEILGRLDGIERQLADVKTAITGNETMGHRGIVQRLDNVELYNAEVPGVHAQMENSAKEARSKIHDRIDALEEKLTAQHGQLAAEWERFKYIAIGIALGAGLAGGLAGAKFISIFTG